MREGIEDRIIAYFDGRLTDHESAELLHRVSVSPEIRKLFREHEMLRELARSAQASAVVRPELEADLFSRIEALAAAEQAPMDAPVAEEERRRKAVPFFWTRWRLGLATALGAFVLGTAITLGPELFTNEGNNDSTTTANTSASAAVEKKNSTSSTSAFSKSASSPSASDAPEITSKEVLTGNNDIAHQATASAKQDFNKIIRGNRDYEARHVANERLMTVADRTHRSYESYRSHDDASSNANSVEKNKTEGLEVTVASSQPISSVSAKSNSLSALGGEKGNLPVFRAEDLEQEEATIEIAAEASSGFAYPADGPGVQPFADPRVSVGYFLDRQNIVGVRLASGLFQGLPETTVTTSAAYTTLSRNLEQERHFNPGVYFTHREFGVLSDLINFDASVGAGYLSNGYTLSGELGLRMPISSRIFINASFALTRVHINAPSMDEISNSVSVEDGPVLIEGSDIENTINGRIHYGLSYQF